MLASLEARFYSDLIPIISVGTLPDRDPALDSSSNQSFVLEFLEAT